VCRRADRLEVRPALGDELAQHVLPVRARVPRDARRRVDLDGHHLAHARALDEDDERAEPAGGARAVVAPCDVGRDGRIARDYRRAGDERGVRDRESARAR
jgi:hypothetical protein